MESFEKTEEAYDGFHERVSMLLGSQYDQRKIDAITESAEDKAAGMQMVEEELKEMPEEPEQRQEFISEWYKKHEVESLPDEEIEEAEEPVK